MSNNGNGKQEWTINPATHDLTIENAGLLDELANVAHALAESRRRNVVLERELLKLKAEAPAPAPA